MDGRGIPPFVRELTRRRVALSVAGLAVAGLSACTADQDDDGPTDDTRSDDGNNDVTADDEPTNGDDDPSDQDPDDENGGSDENDEGGPEPDPRATARATIDWGEEIGNFEDWFGLAGTHVFPNDEAGLGDTPALEAEIPDATYGTMGYQFPEPLELGTRHLSTAVKVADPAGGQLEIRLRAPGSDDRLVCARRLPSGMRDWMRVDMGVTRGKGSPDLQNVTELRLHVAGAEETDVRYWIDDIRLTESSGESFAILAFYGGRQEHYDTVFPILEDRGFEAAVPVNPGSIGRSGRMGIDELRALRDAGWDVCSFPSGAGALPELHDHEQEREITNTQEELIERGFEDGARHFFAPRHRMDGHTIDVVQEVHETGFLFGGNSAGMPPTAPHTLPVINGGDYDGSRSVILRADRHEQLVVLAFDRIGEEGMSVEDFERQLDRIEDNDYAGGLNVITPSTLVDEHL